MNDLDKLSDKEFIPFLQNLGVDTRNQSFEWMLNNSEFAPALEWIYYHLDSNNVLSDREKRRYEEIQKQNAQENKIVLPNEIDKNISSIQQQYPGICLPGDLDGLEEMEEDLKMQTEKYDILVKHEKVLRDLIRQKESTNEQLNLDITKLNSAQNQASDEEKTLAQECIKLAEEVEELTSEVIEVVGNTMDVYGNCGDKDTAPKFFAFGPFDQYKQSQELFLSHFDLYASKKFDVKNEDQIDDNVILNEAKNMERRLTEAIMEYIDSKAELCSEQAKLELVSNYETPHSSQISTNIIQAQTAVQLLEQEEGIINLQIQNAIKDFVDERTNIVEETAFSAALAVRETIYKDLNYLLETTQHALVLDKILYSALRHELHNIEEFLLFASQLKQFVEIENEAVTGRICSMNEIRLEQMSSEQKLLQSDVLLSSICAVLGIESTNNISKLVKGYNDLRKTINESKEGIEDGYRLREENVWKFKQSMRPLIEYIWDGCTKQPNSTDKTVATLTHQLEQEMSRTDARILDASAKFNQIKKNDNHLRKLWQWFLTDPSKLLSSIKAAESGKYS